MPYQQWSAINGSFPSTFTCLGLHYCWGITSTLINFPSNLLCCSELLLSGTLLQRFPISNSQSMIGFRRLLYLETEDHWAWPTAITKHCNLFTLNLKNVSADRVENRFWTNQNGWLAKDPRRPKKICWSFPFNAHRKVLILLCWHWNLYGTKRGCPKTLLIFYSHIDAKVHFINSGPGFNYPQKCLSIKSQFSLEMKRKKVKLFLWNLMPSLTHLVTIYRFKGDNFSWSLKLTGLVHISWT